MPERERSGMEGVPAMRPLTERVSNRMETQPIVAIGLSADGLGAIRTVLRGLPVGERVPGVARDADQLAIRTDGDERHPPVVVDLRENVRPAGSQLLGSRG
jgi:hypothetical protein